MDGIADKRCLALLKEAISMFDEKTFKPQYRDDFNKKIKIIKLNGDVALSRESLIIEMYLSNENISLLNTKKKYYSLFNEIEMINEEYPNFYCECISTGEINEKNMWALLNYIQCVYRQRVENIVYDENEIEITVSRNPPRIFCKEDYIEF